LPKVKCAICARAGRCEAGLPYRTRLLELGDQDKPEYRALQPFGQVPILEEDGRVLFESGAIVLHIGELAASLCLLLKSLGMTSRRAHQSDDRRKGEGQ
jgi:glutathione S-transferase